ncbi:MAG: DUF4097 family beta strand repeat protein [Lachnospiraceae bacterium]|nr:DUF4097 family beta strand repeat protein [Lachnospiraceae bacterium]
MKRWFREAGKGCLTLLAVLTLMVQSVLPVYADTVDPSGAGYTVEEGSTYSLDYFNRIAVNSVRGVLTIRSGEDFSISFPAGWETTPGFSVQDDILVVSGRRSDEGSAQNGSAVVLGEDEPGDAAQAQTASEAAEGGTEAAGDATAEEYTAEIVEETSSDSYVEPEMVITIPAGVGLDTLRIAMEEGTLVMTDITANSVTIQSGGGGLIMRDVSLGTVDIYSDTGEVSMNECTFNSLNIGMGEGAVTVESDDGLARCRMEIKTGDGEITYNGASQGTQYLQPGNGKRFLTIQVGSGDISISG